MTTLIEWLQDGGGLEGASPRQVKAILDNLQTMATIVEHRTLPQAQFAITTDGNPVVAYHYPMTLTATAAPFAHEHLSPARAMRAVREATAVHAAVTSAVPDRAASYAAARELYVRRLLEVGLVAEGGSQALAGGVL